jgi:hypothetical protein
MDNPEFPPNSEASRRVIEDKNLTRVTSGEVVRKKKPLRKRFQESIVGGTPGMAVSYVVMDVLLPAAKDMIVESVHSGVEKLIFGESRRYRGMTRPESGNLGYVNYNRFSGPMSGGRLSSSQRAMSRQARARHDFDEIILDSRTEAEEVIDQLFEVINRYGAATVADLYDLVGLASNHQDHKWGWSDIRGAGVSRDRNGYLLDLPDPHPLD